MLGVKKKLQQENKRHNKLKIINSTFDFKDILKNNRKTVSI